SLTAIAFWALVVVALVALFRGVRGDSNQVRRDDDDAHRILDQRFARGEIDTDEYHARQVALRSAH
ncbi:SHOCT domain-containing protein, partial [Knoellia aerolata]|uniref:SHOCT domain-containing protein n=1 Tax=Knoellia aerolata TaxID=442954 RepID=UPI00055FDA53